MPDELVEKGKRVRSFFAQEALAMLAVQKNIETLLPASNRGGASHAGEEGRYLEALVRTFLKKHLPNNLEVLTGFVLRPAVKTGGGNRARRNKESDDHSTQLDVIVYDTSQYPVYERYEEFAIVPPEGVVAVVSIKKNLYKEHIARELLSLAKASDLCRCEGTGSKPIMGPWTAVFAFGSKMGEGTTALRSVYEQIEREQSSHHFDKLVGAVINLSGFSIFKERPKPDEGKFDKKASYLGFEHAGNGDLHFGLQFLLTGILASYYHPTRRIDNRPGYTSFPTGYARTILGQMAVPSLRWK